MLWITCNVYISVFGYWGSHYNATKKFIALEELRGVFLGDSSMF